MLRDEIILVLDHNFDVEVKRPEFVNLNINSFPFEDVLVETHPTRVIYIDLESTESGNPIINFYGKVARAVLFTKSVIGRKTTFGRSAFTITNKIQSIGTAYIDPNNHNLASIPIIFGRAVSGKKTTFGKISRAFNVDIQTTPTGGTTEIVDFYGDGTYGEDTYGTLIEYGSGEFSLAIGFGSTISGSIPVKQTSVGEVSLASHTTPFQRSRHSINIRARTTTGSSGVLKAALYEGAVNRSGDLVSEQSLTNTFANYKLDISEVAAATITDYSNLSIKFWGYDLGGNPLTFEIADIYLEVPIESGSVQHGVISSAFTFGRSVSGVITSKQTPIGQISLAAHSIPDTRTNHKIKVRARTTSGSNGVLKVALYEGANNRSGDLITQPLTNILAEYTLVILNSMAETISDYSNLSIKFWGYDINGSGLVFEVADIHLEVPVSSGNITQYGTISRAFTFGRSVSGVIPSTTKYGSVSRSITFTKAVSGIIKSKKTSIAEISLASHGTPSTRTNHSIKVRARTTSGSTGVLRAELYEGTTLRSGATSLETSALTNSLTDYTLAIPDSAAATITDYSNLSIKFWGFDGSGNVLTFEVADIYLELPPV
jgi:hypothetical protein